MFVDESELDMRPMGVRIKMYLGFWNWIQSNNNDNKLALSIYYFNYFYFQPVGQVSLCWSKAPVLLRTWRHIIFVANVFARRELFKNFEYYSHFRFSDFGRGVGC